MGRKILFITTDQQRYDSLGCNGGTLSRTPVVAVMSVFRSMPTKPNPVGAIAFLISTTHPVHYLSRRRGKSCVNFLNTNIHPDLWHHRQRNRRMNIHTHWICASKAR